MNADYLSLAAMLLGIPSVVALVIGEMIDSFGNSGVYGGRLYLQGKPYKIPWPFTLLRKRMAKEPVRWNKREFYMKFYGLLGISLALLIEVAAIAIRISQN